MVSAALGQHDLRVTPVTQWLQGQAMRVLVAVDGTLHASQKRRIVSERECFRFCRR
jgi:hypothetical protein